MCLSAVSSEVRRADRYELVQVSLYLGLRKKGQQKLTVSMSRCLMQKKVKKKTKTKQLYPFQKMHTQISQSQYGSFVTNPEINPDNDCSISFHDWSVIQVNPTLIDQ